MAASRKRAEEAMDAFAKHTEEVERLSRDLAREAATIEWAEQFPARKLGDFDAFVRAAGIRERARRPDPVAA